MGGGAMAKSGTFVEKARTRYLMTWNCQGNKFRNLFSYLDRAGGIQEKINVVCCQEFGSPTELSGGENKTDHSYKFVPFTAREGGMHVFWHSWSRTHNPREVSDNLRCTVAIIRIGKQKHRPVCEVLLDQAQRPCIGIEYVAGETWIYSFHNDAHGGASGPARSMLSTVAEHNESLAWIVAGDFNCPPTSLHGAYKVRWDQTRTTTRRTVGTGAEIANNLYDYLVQTSRDADVDLDRRLSEHIGQRLDPVATGLSSDHFPVLFQIYSTKGMMDS
jgi:endonuclease/exonuclease/phosphatase family metal-dependent hydrolase